MSCSALSLVSECELELRGAEDRICHVLKWLAGIHKEGTSRP